MSFFDQLTDDQIAIIGCAIALVSAFAVMALTGAIRQSADDRSRQATSRPRTAPVMAEAPREKRRAA